MYNVTEKCTYDLFLPIVCSSAYFYFILYFFALVLVVCWGGGGVAVLFSHVLYLTMHAVLFLTNTIPYVFLGGFDLLSFVLKHLSPPAV